MRAKVIIFGQSLNSQFLKGLTHSAMVMPTQYKIDECFQKRVAFSNSINTNSVFGSNIVHIYVLLIHKTILNYFFAEPVICDPIMGAIGGPCSGHLSVSHVALMEASAVGQLNSLSWFSQTWAASPAKNVLDCDVGMMWSRANGCINLKHHKNCECCPCHSLFKDHKIIVYIVVLNCQQCNQCLKCQVSGHRNCHQKLSSKNGHKNGHQKWS